MALKDLVADDPALKEQAIESIVTEYVRYDSKQKVIVFTTSATNLTNKQKVLIYLVAIQGWPFISDEPVPNAASPSDLERALGIPGNTLRPLLKDLHDRHLIASHAQKYFVHTSPFQLASIQTELGTHGTRAPVSTRAMPTRRRSRQANSPEPRQAEQERKPKPDREAKPAKAKTHSVEGSGNYLDMLKTWVEQGFFDKKRTLNEVQQKFHEAAVILPRTSLPFYLLTAVRAPNLLQRAKENVNGKLVWVYWKRKN
jgi:hypothetical protein